jgi:hypothetical protein
MKFANKVPKKIYGHKTEEVRGGWRKLHKGELDDSAHNQIILEISHNGE